MCERRRFLEEESAPLDRWEGQHVLACCLKKASAASPNASRSAHTRALASPSAALRLLLSLFSFLSLFSLLSLFFFFRLLLSSSSLFSFSSSSLSRLPSRTSSSIRKSATLSAKLVQLETSQGCNRTNFLHSLDATETRSSAFLTPDDSQSRQAGRKHVSIE